MTIRKKLQNNDSSIGTWMQIPSPEVAEILSKSGKFDWIALDIEHGMFNVQTIYSCIKAIELGQAKPFVRVTEATQVIIKQCLEAGAKGIIYPMISTADQLKEAIDFTLYPPEGKRGVGFSRANLFGMGFDEYLKSINEELTIVAQIESLDGVNNLDEILSNDRLDAIMVGPYDLSGSMGLTGEFDNPKFIDTISNIKSKVESTKVKMGIHVVKPVKDDLDKAMLDGNKFIAYGIDALFLNEGLSAL